MGVKVTNNAFGTISAGISTSDTTITLDSGQGSRFPTLGAGDYFYGTLVDTSNTVEIVKVTARSTDSMTVVRGQDNTTASAFAIGDRFELRPTAALFEAIAAESTVVSDTTPQLGGDLDLNSNSISDGTFLANSSRIRFPNASSAPSSPNLGDAYLDTDDNIVYHWDGVNWISMSNVFEASGGAETTYSSGGNNYKSHTFLSSGTFTVNSGAAQADILVVAGGGGGGARGGGNETGGGGGAGGMITLTAQTLTAGSYTVTVGGGGAGGAGNGSKGSNSQFGSLTAAVGGGFGAQQESSGGNGGSGGGGGGIDSGEPATSGGSATSGQGNRGGNSTDGQGDIGGGGGGKGSAGGDWNGSSGDRVNGGSGASNAYRTGSNITYAGGGGGGNNQGGGVMDIAGLGGSGGGGNGGTGTGGGASGTANKGGGGGGGNINTTGGNGGSGIVVIRYQV